MNSWFKLGPQPWIQIALLYQIATTKGVRFSKSRSEEVSVVLKQVWFHRHLTMQLTTSCSSRMSANTKELRHKWSLAILICPPHFSLSYYLLPSQNLRFLPTSLGAHSILIPFWMIRTEPQIQVLFSWETFYWSYWTKKEWLQDGDQSPH